MTGSVVEAQALPASKLVEEDVPATPGAPLALEPRQYVVGPHHGHRVSVDQKIGHVPGKLAGYLPPSQLRHCAINERTDPVEHGRVEACPAFDQAIGREARKLVAVMESEARHHEREMIGISLLVNR